jgi:hypothetical protein
MISATQHLCNGISAIAFTNHICNCVTTFRLTESETAATLLAGSSLSFLAKPAAVKKCGLIVNHYHAAAKSKAAVFLELLSSLSRHHDRHLPS